MNHVSMIGRLTAVPELKSTPKSVSVCTFTLAVKRPHVKDTTDFINFVAWRGTAEFICRYFTKGQQMAVTGYLTSRSYEDKSGNKRVAYEVTVDSVDFCGDKSNQNTTSAPVATPAAVPSFSVGSFSSDEFEAISDADCPF